MTCANHGEGIACPATCIPGCRCPDGQVIDEEVMSCVDPADCTRKLILACLLVHASFI